MKINRFRFLASVIVIVGMLASLLNCQGEKLTLLPNGPVPLYRTQEDALSGKQSLAHGFLLKGQQVDVVKSIDVKHYQIYKVKSSNGEIGYVNDGDYSLLKNGKKL